MKARIFCAKRMRQLWWHFHSEMGGKWIKNITKTKCWWPRPQGTSEWGGGGGGRMLWPSPTRIQREIAKGQEYYSPSPGETMREQDAEGNAKCSQLSDLLVFQFKLSGQRLTLILCNGLVKFWGLGARERVQLDRLNINTIGPEYSCCKGKRGVVGEGGAQQRRRRRRRRWQTNKQAKNKTSCNIYEQGKNVKNEILENITII